MPETKLSQSKEVTLDGELKHCLKNIIRELEVSRDLCESLGEKRDRLEPGAFYSALKKNLNISLKYVRFSSKSYLKKGD